MLNSVRLSVALGVILICFLFQSFGTKNTHAENKPGVTRNANASYTLVIKKSAYEMTLYDQEGWYGTYPVVFGNKKQDDKRMEGDRLTPEGKFKIVGKKLHGKWGKFLLLDYPTEESYERFNERKAKGEIPRKATIGGGIGIHGTRPDEEWVIDKFVNWTSGCISVRYSDMNELYEMLPVGTEVIIEK